MGAEVKAARQPETGPPQPRPDQHVWEIDFGAELPPLVTGFCILVQSWFDQKQGWQPKRVKGIAQKANGIKQPLVAFLNNGPNPNSPDNVDFYFLLTAANPTLKKSFLFNKDRRMIDVRRALREFGGSVHPAVANSESYWVRPNHLGSVKPLETAMLHPQSALYFKHALVSAQFMPEAKELIDSMPSSRSVIVWISLGNLHNLLGRATSETNKYLDKPPTL